MTTGARATPQTSSPTAPAPQAVHIRPTAAALQETVDDPHYLPANPADLLKADPSRRAAVSFQSAGLRLAGHLYRPPDVPENQKTPAIVMLGPFSSVKEQTLPHYAERSLRRRLQRSRLRFAELRRKRGLSTLSSRPKPDHRRLQQRRQLPPDARGHRRRSRGPRRCLHGRRLRSLDRRPR